MKNKIVWIVGTIAAVVIGLGCAGVMPGGTFDIGWFAK